MSGRDLQHINGHAKCMWALFTQHSIYTGEKLLKETKSVAKAILPSINICRVASRLDGAAGMTLHYKTLIVERTSAVND